MRSDLTTYSLEDCLDALIDYRGKTPRKTESGIPLITAKVVKSGRIEPPNEFIAPGDFDSWMTRGLPMVGDVVMTTEAPLGEVGQLQELPVALAQRIVTLRGKAGVLHNDYLLYVLQSEPVQAQLQGRASGTTVVGIKQSELRKVALDLPPFDVQREVASVLKALDDRIDLLRQTNATLESIAQALFKSWFIDFDPVRAKAEGREPEGMDAATAALFPAEFEESALGLIPRGWSVARLGDMIELAYGKALKATDRRPGCVPVYGSGGITGYHDEALVKHASIVVGRKGTVGALYWEDAPFFPIDTTFYVKPKMTPLTFCFYAMQRLGLMHMNTDAAVPGLNRENAYRLEVLRPVGEVLEAFDHLVGPLREAMRTNGLRADTLVQLRGSLLPRLISGKLRLPEAQAQLEEAIA